MATTPNYQDRTVIREILSETRVIAVVGLSSRPERAGYYVPAYLKGQGYRVIPVNPYLESALSERSYPDLLSVPIPIDLVLLFRKSDAVLPFVDQAIEIGARAVWMQLGIVNYEAANKAFHAGIKVVMDACMLIEHRRQAVRL